MISKAIFPEVVKFLERGLNASSLRNTVLADNLANVDTPGFKRSDVSFEGLLAEESRRSSNGSAGDGWQPKVVTDSTTSTRQDGNNVDVDAEMTKLAENTIYYDALVKQISSQFALLRSAITEGRR
ncbi:MAG TPA: flagellar basal body rod protein FlgB [Bacillota bacterium]